MFRFYNPHYKRDRDHKKIVADNRRYEQRMQELREGLFWIATNRTSTEDNRPPQEVFAALRAAERRTQSALHRSKKLRLKRSKAFTARQKKKRRANPSRTPKTHGQKIGRIKMPALGRARVVSLEPRDMSGAATEDIILKIEKINSQIETLGIEFDKTPFTDRKHLLGQRLFHKRTQRNALYNDLHRIGTHLLGTLQGLSGTPGAAKMSERRSTQLAKRVSTIEDKNAKAGQVSDLLNKKKELLNPNKRITAAPKLSDKKGSTK